MEDKDRTAIVEELQRQAAEGTGLKVGSEDDRLVVRGPVDLDALAQGPCLFRPFDSAQTC